MKHNFGIIALLLILFISAHVIGLAVVKYYLPEDKPLPLNIQKPEFDEKTSFLPIFITILVATAIALVLIKFKSYRLWKFWFLTSVFLTLTVSFSSFLPQVFAVVLAIIFSLLKTFKQSVIIHNLTEVFIYGGLAAIFVPVLSLTSIIILLLLVSVYDFIAVRKTKHMISLANFQSDSKIFAGLFIPYSKKNKTFHVARELSVQPKDSKTLHSQAILGGGDIGFTLLFSGVILKNFGFSQALVVSLVAAISLGILFFAAEKDKFYPAMPFLTVGCLVGYGLVLLV